MSPKSTKYNAAAIGRAGAATNEAAPLARAAQYSMLLSASTVECGGSTCGPKFITCLEKFDEDILTSTEVIRAQTLHFKPNFKFSR